jgi:hypothetical protein
MSDNEQGGGLLVRTHRPHQPLGSVECLRLAKALFVREASRETQTGPRETAKPTTGPPVSLARRLRSAMTAGASQPRGRHLRWDPPADACRPDESQRSGRGTRVSHRVRDKNSHSPGLNEHRSDRQVDRHESVAMPIVPPLASPGSAVAVTNRRSSPAGACWGIAPEQTGLALAQLPLRDGEQARVTPAIASEPGDRASPAAPSARSLSTASDHGTPTEGVIASTGTQSRRAGDSDDRFRGFAGARRAIAKATKHSSGSAADEPTLDASSRSGPSVAAVAPGKAVESGLRGDLHRHCLASERRRLRPGFGELRAPDSSPRQGPAWPVLSASSHAGRILSARCAGCFASKAAASTCSITLSRASATS